MRDKIKAIKKIKKLIKEMLLYDRGYSKTCVDCGFIIKRSRIYLKSPIDIDICEAICWQLGVRGWYKRTVEQDQVLNLLVEFSNSGQLTGDKEEDANRLAHLIYEEIYDRKVCVRYMN